MQLEGAGMQVFYSTMSRGSFEIRAKVVKVIFLLTGTSTSGRILPKVWKECDRWQTSASDFISTMSVKCFRSKMIRLQILLTKYI